jgi:AraC-like DNA-binding protein
VVAFDTARPYRLTVSAECDVVVVGLPRAMLGPHADRIGRGTAEPVAADTGVRAVLGAFLSNLGDHAGELSDDAGGHLADALAALLIAGFAHTTVERVDTATGLLERIVAYTRANLADPALSVRSVAQRHGISPRYVHQLFRQQDRTFAAWVRYERLCRIRRDLTDATLAYLTAQAIARRWGMGDPSHLSRALKAEFGLTAAELRRPSP